MTATTAKKMFLLIFVFDIISGSFMVLLMEGLRNHSFIIPRPKKKTSGKCRKIKGKHQLPR